MPGSPPRYFKRSLPPALRTRGVMAALGPTNTGKTHLAIERMVAHRSGMIGLPLRLLAREVYGRVVERVGASAVALITGEEKINPKGARYFICTVEAMPRDVDVEFVAIDEVQLAADPDRGHIFTDHLLNQRGLSETLLVGAGTMRPLIERLMPGVAVVNRPRLSQLSFSGEKKLTRLPRRAAIVAFSAEEVYAVAELIRRHKGGAAVVLGALSPRTRNAQVELFQSGDVDYLIATDAIGMGLNLDLDHVAFASDRKFDGNRHRQLTPAEFAQIAGRAGRYMRDGTFGTSGRCPPFEPELIEAIESHAFEPVKLLQWRNPDLDCSSIAALQASLAVQPREAGLARAAAAEDVTTLESLAREDEVRGMARDAASVARLWEVCQLPDYRKGGGAHHAELAGTIFRQLMTKGRIPVDWFAAQVAALKSTDGDIDSLSARIAQIRTWTFVANRSDWLPDPKHWQGVTRRVEDSLSDALHDRLAARFVDRRTSVLMRRLRENTMLEATVSATGDVLVEGQHVGTLQGFRFTADARASGPEMKALNAAAARALAGEIGARAARVALGADDAFVLSNDGFIRWDGEPIARLTPGEQLMATQIRLLADEHLSGPAREQVELKLGVWFKAHLTKLLGPLQVLEAPADLTGAARGIAFQVFEALGVLERSRVAEEVKSLDQDARGALRRHGVRFGAYHLYLPAMLKPAPRSLAVLLWALKHGGPDTHGLTEIVHLAASGRTSIPVDKEVSRALYRAGGFRVCGERAIRVDILERLADLIRPAINYRPGVTPGLPPEGSADGEGFVISNAMTSLVGCSGPDFASVLRSLGYVSQSRPGPAITVPLLAAAPVEAPAPAAETPTTGEAEAASEPAPASQSVAEAEPAEASAEAPAEAPAEAVADAGAAPVQEDSAPAVEAPAPAVAEAEIEVWRQHRAHHGEGRRPGRGPRARGQGQGQGHVHGQGVRGEAATPGAEGAEARSEGRPRRPDHRRGGGKADLESAGSAGRPPREGGGRPDQRGERGPRRFDRKDGPKGEGRERQAQRFEAPARKAEREPDPNSPFAKLLALKAELEGRSKS